MDGRSERVTATPTNLANPADPASRPDDPDCRGFTAAVHRRARRLAWAYAVGAVALIPWVTWLALSLPRRSFDHHYKLAWVGFDLILAVAMARTAYLGFLEDARMEIPATATATLLVVDAWFDVTTSSSRGAVVALAFAVFAELPIAALSLYVAHRANARLADRAGVPLPGPARWHGHLVGARVRHVPPVADGGPCAGTGTPGGAGVAGVAEGPEG